MNPDSNSLQYRFRAGAFDRGSREVCAGGFLFPIMKTCFKCHKEKERSEFYSHRMMGDGLLGKCKECTKADSARRIERKKQDPVWRAQERARCREKSKKERILGKIKPIKQETRQKWDAANREKKHAHRLMFRAIRSGKLVRLPCEVCGDPNSHGHHHDYSKPLDVWWLCPVHHGQAHWKDNPLVIVRTPETTKGEA